MRFKSFLQVFSRVWRRNKTVHKKVADRRSARLLVEMLERRELLANDVPTLVTSGILPPDGSTLAISNPILQVQFSETMTTSVLTTSNYILLGSSGNSIPVNAVNFVPIGGAPINSAVQIAYNSGNPLVVDSYSLFLRGDRMVDADDGFALAQPGQLVVANSGRSNVTVSTLPGDATVGALGNYNAPAAGTTLASPRAVTNGDFDGDGLPDLAVVNSGTETVTIYQGQSTSEGGGFHRLPDLTLNLAASAGVTGRSVTVADFNNDSKLDLAVANFDLNTVTVFLNTRTSVGTLAFNAGTAVATDAANPTGVAAADIDGDAKIDLIVSLFANPTDISTPADSVLDYRIQVFPGDGLGGFTAAPIRVRTGDTAGGLRNPNTVIPGLFDGGSTLPQLAVAGSTGLLIIRNTSVPGTFNLAPQPALVTTTQMTNLTAGQFDAGGTLDLAGIDALNRMEIFANLGTAAFLPPTLISFPGGVGATLAAGDLNGDGLSDIVVPGGPTTSNLTNMVNTTVGGTISAASNVPAADIVITSNNHRLVVGQPYSVVISGALGNTNANGTRAITVIDANRFSLNGVSGNGLYTGGGTWALTSTITGANGAGGTSPIVITTASTTGLVTGDAVIISGSTFGGANGTFTITVTSPTTFLLNGTNALGTGTGGTWVTTTNFIAPLRGDVRNASAAGGGAAIVITTVSTAALATGNVVTISGSPLAAANGTFVISVTGPTTFTLDGTNPAAPSLTNRGGLWSSAVGFTTAGLPYTVGAGTNAVTLFDTNQDGRLDVVTANQVDRSVTLLLGAGDGSLRTSASTAMSNTTTNGVVLGDVNRDGRIDIVAINNNGNTSSTRVSIMQGLSGGAYSTPIDFTANAPGENMRTLTSVALGDVDGDGDLDVLYTNNQDNSVGFLRNNLVTPGSNITTGSFTAIGARGIGRSPTGIAVGDFNEDGKLDMAVSHNNTGGGFGGGRRGISVRLGNGDFTFQNTTEYNDGDGMSAVITGDFDKDGNLDFIAAEATGNNPGRIWLHKGDGTGGFIPSSGPDNDGVPFGTGVWDISALDAADFNGDGFLDVVVSSRATDPTGGATGVAVLLNLLGTGFSPTPLQTDVLPGTPGTPPIQGTGLADVLTTDANQDGFADLIVATHLPILSGTVTGSTGSGTSPIVLNVNSTSSLAVGMQVVIAGVQGNTAANGTWTITAIQGGFGGPRITLGGTTGNGAYAGGGTWTIANAPYLTNDNVLILTGLGTGRFNAPVPYLAGAIGSPSLAPSFLAVTPSALMRVTTFTSGGTTVNTDLIVNGDFEEADLTGETGNLLGWKTFKFNVSPGGTHGGWAVQASDSPVISPLSGTVVTGPVGEFRAMLDQPNQRPYDPTNNNPNPADTYAGTHLLYQDVTIPAGAFKVEFSLNLYIENADAQSGFSDTTTNPSLDFRTAAANQQVRIDIMSTSGNILGVDAAGGVLRNLYQTNSTTTNPVSLTVTDPDLTAFAGQTVRLRIATANNQGRLIVGIDSVTLKAQFNDSAAPTISGLRVSNPAFISSGIAHTNDPTLVGVLADNSGLNGISFVEFDPKNNGFGGADDLKITQWDAQGNFSFKLPNTPAGLNTVGVRVVDRAGNRFPTALTFFMQSSSVTEWEAVGPQGIAVNGQGGVDYTKVSGRVTVTVPDLNDPSGNTYFVGSVNGGVWKTTDGGNHWVALTNSVTDATGKAIPVPIGGMAQSRANPNILYAATGVGDQELDSKPGVGVLKSIDGGQTWTLIGNSNTVLAGAKAVKVVVSADDPNIAYVGVAAGGASGPGVYKTTNGGLTWANVLNPAFMNTSLGVLGAGTALDSVTDLIIDPAASDRLFVGLGRIGLITPTPTVKTTGMWFSSSGGASWTLVQGGAGAIANNTLPNGRVANNDIGRVTIAMGHGRIGDEGTVYVLMSGLPGNNTPPNVDWGSFTGLFRTTDNMLNFTRVMLRQDILQGRTPAAVNHNFVNINLFARDAANAGAMVVDPNNANVVYIGGSDRWFRTGDAPNHMLIRVDTGNMRDTRYVDPATGAIPNDGDDRDKFAQARSQTFFYDPVNSVDPYVGEGVYWYDLNEDQSGDRGNLESLPPAVTSLAIDASGRLLVGTMGGIWRGVPHGFSYDRTSGNTGIIRFNYGQGGGGGPGPPGPPSRFDVPGMTFTSINGNLQIADMTSVAIDPFTRGVYFTTQNGTGVAGSTAPLDWVSQGLTGPTTPSGQNLGIPNAGFILTSNPSPGAPTAVSSATGTGSGPISIVSSTNHGLLTGDKVVTTGISGFPAANGTFTITVTGVSTFTLNGTDGAVGTSSGSGFWSPGPLPGTPVTLYRVWQYANPAALQPETSIDNGLTWSSINSSGINTNIPAGRFPAFAVNPNPVLTSGVWQNQLMFGTQFVYFSPSSGTVWDPSPDTSPMSPTGANISALAFAPSATGVRYAGTEDGRFFGTFNQGADGWPEIDTGLPVGINGVFIRGIAVDPNDPLKVFVMYGDVTGTGTLNHVFRSANGGTSWTNVSAGLQNVAAYSMVIDRAPGLGAPAPNGKIYVATEVGVFYSLDDGGTWTRLGAGMPNVPVVDLKYDAGLHVLAAATLGRGVYTINTSPFSFISDQVIDEDTVSNAIPFSVNDPGNVSYTITASSDNQGLIPDGNIGIGGSGASRTIQFLPFANANSTTNGVANITVTLSSSGFSYSQAFKVTVNPINDLPTVSAIGTQVTLRNTPLAVDFTIGDVETPDNALVVAATSSNTTVVPNNAANLTLTGSGPFRTLTITPAANQTGTTTITISVTDADFGITTRTFTLLVTTSVSLPFTDDFNRANSSILGAGWNVNAGTVTINNSKASFAAGGGIASLNQLVAVNLAVQADVTVGTSQDLGLIARYQPGLNSYYMGLINNIGGAYVAQIYRNIGGSFTLLASKPVAFGDGTLRFELADTSLKLFYGPVGGPLALVAYANDSTFLTAPATGSFTAGFRTNSGNVTADNFSATAIALATPAPLPFSDNFNSLANGAQLSLNWVNRSANFSAQSQGMVAAADPAASVATVFGLALGNSLAQASVNVSGTNSSAGVVARYSLAGYYVGLIVDTGAGFQANIYRADSAGNLTQLSVGSVASGAGILRLEAVGASLKLFFGATLGSMVQVSYAYDSSFAVGSTGFRGSAGMRVDDFTTNTITLTTPTFAPTPFTDSFSSPINGNQLSRNWQYQAGNFIITPAGILVGNDPGASIATVNGSIADVSVQADVAVPNSSGQNAGLITRYSAAGYYFGLILANGNNNYVAVIDKFTPAGSFETLAVVPLAGFGGSGSARFETVGTSLKLFVNGALAATAFDSQLTTGSVGFRNTSGITADNFQAGAITPTTPVSLPFVENFSTTSNGNQLSRNWDESQGNFTVSANTAIANSAVSLATVHGIVLADTAIQASFAVGAGQHAGLIVRANAAAGNQYLGVILANANATSFTLAIYRAVNGSYTQLAATTVASGTGTFKLEAVGANLKLFHATTGNPLTLALHAYDSVLASGNSGMRSGNGAVMSNLTLDRVTLVDPTVPPGSYPFVESFSTAVNGNQISRNWDERLGNFAVGGGSLVAVDPLNLATVHGAIQADTSIQANVSVGINQNAGLITRFNAATGDFYLGVIVGTSNPNLFSLNIYRFLGGSATLLATTNVASGVGTMLLENVGSSLKLFYAPTGNPLTLALYAFDGSIASGQAGVRNGRNAVMSNLTLNKVTLVNTTAPFQETFTNPVNGNQMPRNWDERSGEFFVGGGSAVAVDNGITMTTVHGLTLADASVQANVSVGTSQHAGVIARYSVGENYYLAAIVGTSSPGSFTLGIYRALGGTITQIASATTNTGTGTLRLDASGTSLKLYYNGVLQTFAYDTFLGSGLVGLRVGKNATLTGFSVSQIVRTTPVIPFTDNFNTGVVLSSHWSEREGLVNLAAGRAVGFPTAAFTTATVNTPVANPSVQVDISLPATGVRHAGLVARFDPTTSNMYMARIVSVNGALRADIFKRVSGAFTMLASVNFAGSGTGTARLEVVAGNIKFFYGPTAATATLVAFANDATPLGGTSYAGVYIGPNDSVDNFALSNITVVNPPVPFADNFNAADGTQLSRAWLETSGNFGVSGNRLLSKDAINYATVNGLNLGNTTVTADVAVATNQQAGLLARFQAGGNWYLGRIRNSNGAITAEIYRSVNGTPVLLASTPVGIGTGTLTFQVVGANLKLFFGATLATQTLVTYAYDTFNTSGTAGLLSTVGASYDNFALNAVSLPTTQPSPFTETFAANPPTQQLSSNFLERAGNFNVSTGQAVGQAASNIATVNGISAVGADLQAVVTVSAANQVAGVVARYSGNPGADSYYAAQVTFLAANSYKVEIVRVIGGVKTTIGTVTVPAFTGTLRFLVVGSNLSVYLDNSPTPTLAITDSTIATAGLVGMLTSANVKVTSFRST